MLIGLAIMLFTAYYNFWLATGGFVLAVLLLALYKRYETAYKIAYILLGFLLAFSAEMPLIAWIAALILLAGFPIGSLASGPVAKISPTDFWKKQRHYYLFLAAATIGVFLS